jgi:hypothetical protein
MATRPNTFRPQVETLEDRLALSGSRPKIVTLFLPTIGKVFESVSVLRGPASPPSPHALTVLHPQTLGPLFLTIPDLHDANAHQNPNTFVGQVAGTNLFLAVVVGNGEALAYTCDAQSISTWLRGPISGNVLTLSGGKPSHCTPETPCGGNALTLSGGKGNSLVGTLDGDTVSGTLTLSGRSFTFQAARVVEGHTGLFRGNLPLLGRPGVGSAIKIESSVRGVMQRVPRIGHIYCC